MTPTLYLYPRDAAPGETPLAAGRVEVTAGEATLHDAGPAIGPLVGEILAMPALPLTTEEWIEQDGRRQLVMKQALVRRGEPAWAHAIAQAVERVLPLRATVSAT
jgi:hypothetical protein